MPDLLIKAQGLQKQYGDRRLFAIDSLYVYEGDRIGLVGVNGSGKSTLLHILAGLDAPEAGQVTAYGEVSYMRQFGGGESGQTDEDKLHQYGVWDKQERANVSGGEQTRLKAAFVFSGGARNRRTLYVLDEPTANLDSQGVRLFSRELARLSTFVLVSHDRGLLEDFCTAIWELHDGTLAMYEGNYSAYLEQKRRLTQHQMAEYEQYAAEKKRLTSALRERADKAGSIRKAPSRMGNSEARLHKREATAKQAKIHGARKTMETRLGKLEAREKPREADVIKLDFALTRPPANKEVIRAEGLCFAYGDEVLFDDASFCVPNGSKTALLGGNGSGKTTLLNLIARGYEGIYTAPKGKIGYFYQGFENIDMEKTALANVMEDSVQTETLARTVLGRLLFKREDVHKKAGVLSGGERVKLSFAKLFVSDCNILLLDEPTNYLDIASLEVLQSLLAGYEGTVVFVSHDRVFTEAVADRRLEIRDRKICLL